MPQPMHAIDILLAHDKWSTDQLLGACKPLEDAALDRSFEMGRGSLRKTLTHIIDVIDGWHAGLAGWSPVPVPADSGVAELIESHEQIYNAFAAFVQAASSDDTWTAVRGERKLTAPRDIFVSHIVTHGMHHRAQALNMLRHLGVATQPQSSVMQWMLATGAGQLQYGATPSTTASAPEKKQ